MTQEVSTSLQFVFSCPLSSGLHARPASHLAEVVNQFASDCTLTNLRNGLMANGKSVLGIIAADIRYSDQCAVRVSGADEHSAHAALRQFVAEALPLCDVPLAVSAAPIRSNTPPRPLKAAGVSCSFGVPVSRGIAHGRTHYLNVSEDR